MLGRRIAALALALLATVATAPAYSGRGDETLPKKTRSFAIRHPLPFKFGERLVYDVKFSRFPISANVGELTFAVTKPNGSDQHVKFEVSAVSRGALVSLFGIKVQDTFTTLVDRNDMFVYSTIKNIHENDFRSREEAIFDRQTQKVRYRVIDPNSPTAATTSQVELETKPWVQDIVSAIYFARTRKLKNVGREVHFPISDQGQTYDIGVALMGSEQIKVDAGTFSTIKVDARIFNGRYVRREGTLHIWFTDDARRIPVKAQMKTEKGTATFVLKRIDEGQLAIEATKPAEPAAVADEE